MITVTLGGRRRMLGLFHGEAIPESKGICLMEIPSGLTLLSGEPGHIECQNAVFVAAKPEDLPESFSGERCVAVLDSANGELRSTAARLRLPALTCGLSGADSFTVSSWQGDRAVVSLLRPLTAFDGAAVEPFDLPVAFDKPPEPFDLLACAAVHCLLGEKNPLNGTELWQLPC